MADKNDLSGHPVTHALVFVFLGGFAVIPWIFILKWLF